MTSQQAYTIRSSQKYNTRAFFALGFVFENETFLIAKKNEGVDFMCIREVRFC